MENSTVMFRLAVVFAAISCAYAQLHSICHSNVQQLTEAQVISQWALRMDRNGDGDMTTGEIVLGFRDILGGTLPVGDNLILAMDDDTLLDLGARLGYNITRHDFIQGWHQTFHDNIDFIGGVFDAFDTNHDNLLTMVEIEGILNLMKGSYDANQDGVIQETEFVKFFEHIYTCAASELIAK
ncbi:hypothetical protein MQA30_25445 [Escherichia coli]|nr:hypothetical protein [Escherichia coli]